MILTVQGLSGPFILISVFVSVCRRRTVAPLVPMRRPNVVSGENFR